MGDARDTAKKKKADEKKGRNRPDRQAGTPRDQGRGEVRQEVSAIRRIDLLDLKTQPDRGSMASGPGFLCTGGSIYLAPGDLGRRHQDEPEQPRRLRVVSSTKKGCDGTAYCSSAELTGQGGARQCRRARIGSSFQSQAIHRSIRRYSSSRWTSRCSKRNR